jgi:rubrerythrin
MAKKPSYVGLLNAVANGERGGHELFKAWGDTTKDQMLKPTLDMVAVREMEHSWAFEKRLSELGFGLKPITNKKLKQQVRFLKSNASDEEKFASFGVGQKEDGEGDATDGLLQILADKTIDPRTGELMGRFISEERDTGRQLIKAFKAMQRRKLAKKTQAKKAGAKA